MQWHARCTHVQVASATLRYITRTVATQLATNTVIIFLLLNGTLLLCPHRLRHMKPRSIGLIPGLPVNTKLSKEEQNTHRAMQLCCRVCPHIADNPPLPQACKEVLHACAIETMDIVISLLGFTRSCRPNIMYKSVQVGPHAQPERGQSISPTGKEAVHIPNRKGASPYSQLKMGRSISPTGKGPP